MTSATTSATTSGGGPVNAIGTAMTTQMHSVVPQGWIAAAIEDATQRTGASRDRISIETLESVTWPDGALGCPEPGVMYTQALVPGYRLVLRVDQQQHLLYHASTRGPFKFCPADRATTPTPANNT